METIENIPKIVESLKNIEAKLGELVQLTVHAVANPRPEVN